MHPDNSLLNERDNTARAQRANERSCRNNDTPSLALRAGEGWGGGGLRVHRRVLREELLDARLRLLERLAFLPLQNQLRIGKKLCGFYNDLERENHSTYTINVNMLTSTDHEA